jgi:hypothetical protein
LSCEKELPLGKATFTKKLVVNAFNEADSLLKVNVSQSVSLLETPSTNEFNGKAKVLVLKDGLILFNDSIQLSNGGFRLPYKCTRGSVYELQVAYKDFPTVRAKDSVPQINPNITIDTLVNSSDSKKLVFKLIEPVGSHRYYLQLFSKGKEWNGLDSIEVTKRLNYKSDDKIFISNILTISSDNSFSLFDDGLINGTTKSVSLNISNSDLNLDRYNASEIIVSLSEVSRNMYEYYLNLLENTHVYGGPLASTSLVNGNIDQGLGAFCFYSKTIQTVKID